MSHISKAKKVKPKGTVRELKLVHSISRRGADIVKSEEVKTPKKKNATTIQHNASSSPIKRLKLEAFNTDGIPCDLEEHNVSEKRQTLVCLFRSRLKATSNYI